MRAIYHLPFGKQSDPASFQTIAEKICLRAVDTRSSKTGQLVLGSLHLVRQWGRTSQRTVTWCYTSPRDVNAELGEMAVVGSVTAAGVSALPLSVFTHCGDGAASLLPPQWEPSLCDDDGRLGGRGFGSAVIQSCARTLPLSFVDTRPRLFFSALRSVRKRSAVPSSAQYRTSPRTGFDCFQRSSTIRTSRPWPSCGFPSLNSFNQ